MSPSLNFPFEYWIEHVTFGLFISYSDSLLGYYCTGKFQALQLIALVVFGAVDWTLASCMLVHFVEIKVDMIRGC